MIQIKTLNNGIRVVLEEIPYVRSVSFGIWVGSGSARELPKENGISHFIEHMVFKGTHSRSARQIADEMDALGGQVNAYTTKEYTCFHTRVLDRHLDRAMEVMCDMYLNSRFAPDDISRERNVILEEIAMYRDEPEDLVHEQLQCSVWSGSGLGMTILGTEESLQNIDAAAFADYRGRFYLPQNTVIALAGNFAPNEIMIKLNDLFGGWQPGSSFCLQPLHTRYTPAVVKTEKDIEQLHLILSFPSLPRDHKLKYALSVFNTFFGGGMSSFLFQHIREDRGLTYSIYSYNSVFEDTGMFAVYAGMSPSQTEQVTDLIFDEFKKAREIPVSESLLQKTKEQIISSFIINSESTAGRMSGNGTSVLLRGNVVDTDEVIRQIESVTAAHVSEVANLILNESVMSVSAVGSGEGLACVKF